MGDLRLTPGPCPLVGRQVTFAHGPTNRSVTRLLANLVLAWRLVRRQRPHTVVTTGAGIAVPFCYVARLFGCRVVYVESLSRVSEPSLTGRLVAPVAHDFFVQWPQLVAQYRDARYVVQDRLIFATLAHHQPFERF